MCVCVCVKERERGGVYCSVPVVLVPTLLSYLPVRCLFRKLWFTFSKTKNTIFIRVNNFKDQLEKISSASKVRENK